MTTPSESQPEVVPPSSEPDAAVSTGSGSDRGAQAPPPPSQAASTSGLGTVQDQQGSAPPADGAYDLTPEHRDESQSDSGT